MDYTEEEWDAMSARQQVEILIKTMADKAVDIMIDYFLHHRERMLSLPDEHIHAEMIDKLDVLEKAMCDDIRSSDTLSNTENVLSATREGLQIVRNYLDKGFLVSLQGYRNGLG